MSSKIHLRIELFANIAIILVAFLLGYFLIQKLILDKSKLVKTPKDIEIGSKVNLPDVDWQKKDKTLLIVMQKSCRFCTESMPFYRTLFNEAKGKETNIVAVLPDSQEESIQYLKDNGVEIQEIKQSQLNSINVHGTPTLILVDKKGTVLMSWRGKLPPEKEQEVLSSL